MQFAAVIIALAASAQAFAPSAPMKVSTVVRNTPGEKPEIGKGGMADTRDPEPFVNDRDKRQRVAASISEAPSFEEYLKSRK
ncbi:hypothetical protein M885DRAFT_574773 [Pelagophyceae sp. CCMP2097]|nr:hypothetical protein M885DRAFT_574773 [Pelagophyceae sp. CCMP2097]